MNVGDLFLRARFDEAQIRRDLTNATEGAGDEAGKKVGQTMGQRIGAGLRQNATKIATGAGAAVGTFVAGAVQQFASFQNQMNEVFTLLPGISQDAMGKMTQQVKDFSNEFGVLPEEVVPGLYSALSAGVPQDNVFAFLETANKAAKAGVTDLNSSVALLTAVTKGYGDTSVEAQKKTADLAFTTVRLGQTTYPELAASIGKVVPQAAALGVAEEELWAITAALTGVTGNTAEVMTQQKAIMTSLLNPTVQMKRGLADLGFESGQAAVDALGLSGTLEALEGATGGNSEAFAKMLGSSEALTAGLAITGGQAETVERNLVELAKAPGAVDGAFETMTSGIQHQANLIAARIKTLALDIGEEFQALGPVFIAFGPTMGRLLGAGLGGIAGFLAKGLIGSWGRVMRPALGLAIKAVGVAGGAAYQAAAFVASKFAAALHAVWALMGGPRIMAAAAAAGAKAGAAMVASIGGTQVGAQLITSLGRLGPAMGLSGATLGGVFGKAFAAAAAVGIAAAVATGIQEAGKTARGAIDDIFGTDFSAQDREEQLRREWTAVGEQVGLSMQDIHRRVADELRAQGHTNATVTAEAWALAWAKIKAELLGQGDDMTAAVDARVDAIVAGYASLVPGAGAAATAATDAMRAAIVTGTHGAMSAMVPEGRRGIRRFAREFDEIGPSLRDRIRDARGAVRQGMDDLMWAIRNPMASLKLTARIEGALTGDRLARGLRSKRPAVRAEAERVRAVLIEQWEEATGESWDYGKSVSENLGGGIRARRRAAREAGKDVGDAATGAMDKSGEAKTIGISLTEALARGISDAGAMALLRAKAAAAAKVIADNTKPGSPTKEGPLSEAGGIEAWGRMLARQLGRGLSSEPVDLVSALGLRALDPIPVMLRGSVGDLGAITAGLRGPAGSGGRGDTNIQVDLHGLPIRAETPLEVAQQLRRMARLGGFLPRRDR